MGFCIKFIHRLWSYSVKNIPYLRFNYDYFWFGCLKLRHIFRILAFARRELNRYIRRMPPKIATFCRKLLHIYCKIISFYMEYMGFHHRRPAAMTHTALMSSDVSSAYNSPGTAKPFTK